MTIDFLRSGLNEIPHAEAALHSELAILIRKPKPLSYLDTRKVAFIHDELNELQRMRVTMTSALHNHEQRLRRY